MTKDKKPKVSDNPKVGLFSRIDFGSRGFRRGILEAEFEITEREGTHFNVLAGGLISRPAIVQGLKEYIKAELRKDKISGKKYKNFKRFEKLLAPDLLPARKAELKHRYLHQIARELADLIPLTKVRDPEDSTKEKCVDLYIITSHAYDGEEGEQVAHMLADLRSDIRVYNSGGDRIEIKYVDKVMWVLTPQKQIFMRGDYYSTAVERVIKDKIKASTQSSPELFVVGCFGSSINKPKGELQYRYVSVPNSSRIEETRVSENQIGVKILEFPLSGGEYLSSMYSLKDLVSKELSFVMAPPGCSKLQRQLIQIMKDKGWATIGIFRNELRKIWNKDIPREDIAKAMKQLDQEKTIWRKGENWPGIIYQEASQKHYFDLEWIQRRLRYQLDDSMPVVDRIVSIACMHAGSIETDYEFLVNDVPNIVLERDAKILVVAGDLKEGLKHNLLQKGEVIAGANSTRQDFLAANLLGTVVMKVFKARFEKAFRKYTENKSKPTAKELNDIVSMTLIALVYWLGNHDLWESEDGHESLTVFHLALVNLLAEEINKHLALRGLVCGSLLELVKGKVLRREFFELPSGLKVSLQHPFMSRAKTTSIRPQEMLDYGKRHGCQVTIGANFHVGENVEEWDQDLGQCVCQEIGTVKHGSNFERRKMKMVDQGVGYLRITSKDKRILVTESAYFGAKVPRPPVDNLDILNAWIVKLGVPPIPGIPIAGEPLK